LEIKKNNFSKNSFCAHRKPSQKTLTWNPIPWGPIMDAWRRFLSKLKKDFTSQSGHGARRPIPAHLDWTYGFGRQAAFPYPLICGLPKNNRLWFLS
jgi:hypothetical protein